jgi:hypothetical protein
MKSMLVVGGLALFLRAAPCLAGDAGAEALFRAGREAVAKGDYATACARFEESHRLEPAAGTVFNLADCYEKRGQVASAWQRYREAKERLPAGDERASFAESRILALEPRLPKLSLELAPSASSATVKRDGVELGAASLGIEVPVDPGAHELVVSMAGHADRKVSVQLAEAEFKRLVLEAGPTVASESNGAHGEAAASSSTSGSSTATAGYVVGGIGAAGIVTSLVLGAMVLDRKSTVDSECVGNVCSQKGVDAANSGKTLSTISTIAFAAGAVGVGVGLYLVLSSKPSAESARLEFVARPGLTTLGVGGRF